MNNDVPSRHDCVHLTGTLVFAVIAIFSFMTGLRAANAADARLVDVRPSHGQFTTRSQIMASGQVVSDDPTEMALTVNGAAVTLAADGAFSHTVVLDAERIYNPVLVDVTEAGNLIARRRPVVIAGPSLPATALAPESLAVRLRDRGIDQLESLVSRFVDFDLATFLPTGPAFSDRVCTTIPPFGPRVCGDVDVTIANDPAPRLGAIDLDLDARPDRVALDIELQDLFVRAEVEAEAGPFNASCTIEVAAASMRVNGALRLEPRGGDPATIDVVQVGDMVINFGNFSDDTDCGGFLGDVIEGIAKRLVGNVQDLLRDGLSDFLNAVDAVGNTPLAEGLESALDMLSLETLINVAIAEFGLRTQVPFARISEDGDGITFVVDTGIDALPAAVGTLCTAPRDNRALDAVYHASQPLPPLGSATPGGLQYDAGGVISTTVLNQALRAATACGLLQTDLTEIDLGNGDMLITAGLLSAFLPAFEQLIPTQPLRVVLRPTLVPIVSGVPGPAGELLDLRVSAYLLEVFVPGRAGPLMQLALDVRAGFDLRLDPTSGGVQPRIGTITDWVSTLIINPLGVDPARIQFLIELLLTQIDDLNDDLEPLEIPPADGLSFEIVEVSRVTSYVGIFLNIFPQP